MHTACSGRKACAFQPRARNRARQLPTSSTAASMRCSWSGAGTARLAFWISRMKGRPLPSIRTSMSSRPAAKPAAVVGMPFCHLPGSRNSLRTRGTCTMPGCNVRECQGWGRAWREIASCAGPPADTILYESARKAGSTARSIASCSQPAGRWAALVSASQTDLSKPELLWPHITALCYAAPPGSPEPSPRPCAGHR